MNKTINKITSLIFSAFQIFILMLTICLIFAYIFKSQLGPDTGYFLLLAKDISEGQKLYLDLKTGYPPISLLFFSLNNHDAGYSVFVTIMVIINGLVSLLAFLVMKRLEIDKRISLVATLLLLISLIMWGGATVTLEPFALVFQLTGILSALYSDKKKPGLIFLSGICIATAFFAKQHALGIMPALLVYFFCSSEKETRITNIKIYVLGLIAGFSIWIALISWHSSLAPVIWLPQLFSFGSRYGFNFDYSLNLWLFLIENIALIAGLYILPYKKSETWLFVLCLLGASSSLIIRQFDHYFLWCIPWAVILFAQITSNLLISRKTTKLSFSKSEVFLIILISLQVVFILNHGVSTLISILTSDRRTQQFTIMHEACELVSPNKEVILFADYNIMWVCNLIPDKILPYQSAYIGNYTSPELSNIIKEGGSIVIDTKLHYFTELISKASPRKEEWESWLKDLGYKKTISSTGRFFLFQRTKPT